MSYSSSTGGERLPRRGTRCRSPAHHNITPTASPSFSGNIPASRVRNSRASIGAHTAIVPQTGRNIGWCTFFWEIWSPCLSETACTSRHDPRDPATLTGTWVLPGGWTGLRCGRYNLDMGNHTLLNDVVFKIVFGSQRNAHLLRALLNAILRFTGDERIAEVEILNPLVDKDYHDDKGAFLDVKARDGHGRLYNIEVQVSNEIAYEDRAIFYASRLFGGQIERGSEYADLVQTICISILDFCLFSDVQKIHSIYRYYDEDERRRLSNKLQIHFIELPKFKKDKSHALRTPFEKWLHVLKFAQFYESGSLPVPHELKEEEGIEMAIDAMKNAWADNHVQEMIEARLKARLDESSRIKGAWRNGKAEGLEEGLEKGLEEGRSEGLRVAAGRMLQEGMDRKTVARVLGTREEDLP